MYFSRYIIKLANDKTRMIIHLYKYIFAGLYAYSCSATWLVFSSSTILFAPIIFEMERAQMEDLQRTQQKQVLLGPNTALSGVNTGLPMAPPVQR